MIVTVLHVVFVVLFCYFALGLTLFCERLRTDPSAVIREEAHHIYRWGLYLIRSLRGGNS